jgi:hypothetical protein
VKELSEVPKFEVITICPIHPNSIVIYTIDAPDHTLAMGKVVGETAFCPVPPGHRFTIHSENIIGWQPLTPTYMPEELGVSAPRRRGAYVPPTPAEKIYYINPEARDKIRKTDWWK